MTSSVRDVQEERLTTASEIAVSRALVLGGGGVTGIAWEVGVLAGLHAAGVALSTADMVIGTSAGAFVGAALASGADPRQMLAAQAAAAPDELPATASDQVMAAWYEAFAVGGPDPVEVGAAMGRIAKAHPEPVPRAARRAVVRARLATTTWPPALRVTAIDADTGRLHVFDATSGVPLEDAVAASGAVPGVWPLEQFAGRAWIDGGMVSAANASLARGHDRVVVLAPLPDGYGAIPGATEDVATLSADAQVLLIAPDEAAVDAVGPNIYDPGRRGPATAAGQVQGSRLAAAVADLWRAL